MLGRRGEGGAKGLCEARRGDVEGDSIGEMVEVEAFEEKEGEELNEVVELNDAVEEVVEKESCRLLFEGIPSNSSIHTQKRKKLSTERALNASFCGFLKISTYLCASRFRLISSLSRSQMSIS